MAVFSVATMAIAVPTGVKIINWTLTMWGGKLVFTTAMLFAIGLVVQFTIGGLSGVTHAVAPSDTQQTDTYYIVAHFHYVLFGGAVLGFFAGFYYWWPKIFGKCLNEKLGKWNFWLMVIGLNMTFGPMHIIGLQGQPRRMYQWTEERVGEGFFNIGFWNRISTIGAFILAIGVLMFVINIFYTHRSQPVAPLDPWDARTLEWMTTSPPKEHNFDSLPTVHALDEFFHRKYEDVGEGDQHDLRQVATAEEHPRRAGGERRPPHPHAVAVVLADRARLLAADHRLRRDLQHVPRHRRRRRSSCSACSDGRSSRRSPRTPSTTRCRRSPRPAAGSPRWARHDAREGDGRAARREDVRPRRAGPRQRAGGDAHAITETIDEIPMGGLPEPGPAPTVDTDEERTHLTDMPEETADRDAHGGHAARPASPTTSWRCGCSSARSACSSAA